MIVNINGAVYRVYWQYGNMLLSTSCHLEVKLPNGEDKLVSFVTIKRFHKDKHDIEKARRASLKKMLIDAFPSYGYDTNNNYSIRAKFWESYRTSTKTPRW
jgi:hypothetical protein